MSDFEKYWNEHGDVYGMEIAEDAWDYQQSKVDELQRRNQMLNDNIKEQGQKLVYQNEVIETQSEKLLSLRDEKAELQKRIDAALEIISCLTDEYTKSELRKALRGQK